MTDLNNATMSTLKDYALTVLLLTPEEVKTHGKLSAKATWVAAIQAQLDAVKDLTIEQVVEVAEEEAAAEEPTSEECPVAEEETPDYTDVHPIEDVNKQVRFGALYGRKPESLGMPSTSTSQAEPMIMLLVALYILLLHTWSLTAPLVKASNHTRKLVIQEIKEQWHAGKRLVLAQP